MKIAIAHFNRPKAWLLTVVMFVLALMPPYFVFVFDHGRVLPNLWNSPTKSSLLILFAMALVGDAVYFFFYFIPRLKQLLFDDARAVWIENDVLVYVRPRIMSVDCREIVRVTPGILKQGASEFEAVILTLRDGETKSFPIRALRETRDAIIAKLNEALHLSK